MEIILIAAMASNRVIGRNNTIPWHLPGELQRFRATTWGHPIIMGRVTHESIGRPLPGRHNIIVTRNPHYRVKGCEVASSLDNAYKLCEPGDRVFNIGGEQLYCQGIRDADSLILTILKQPVAGDVFFPEFSAQEFVCVSSEEVTGPTPYAIQTYCRIANRHRQKISPCLDA
jgi:dihydrofolate reductase